MNTKYQPVLFDGTGKEILRLSPVELKKDAEKALAETDADYATAEIRTVYVRGGEAANGQ